MTDKKPLDKISNGFFVDPKLRSRNTKHETIQPICFGVVQRDIPALSSMHRAATITLKTETEEQLITITPDATPTSETKEAKEMKTTG